MPDFHLKKGSTVSEEMLNEIIKSLSSTVNPKTLTLAEKILFCLEKGVKIYGK